MHIFGGQALGTGGGRGESQATLPGDWLLATGQLGSGMVETGLKLKMSRHKIITSQLVKNMSRLGKLCRGCDNYVAVVIIMSR